MVWEFIMILMGIPNKVSGTKENGWNGFDK